MRKYQDDINKLKQLITERHHIPIVEMKEDDFNFNRADGYASPKLWCLPPQIVIKPGLRDDRHLEVLAHELGHLLENGPKDPIWVRVMVDLGRALIHFPLSDKRYLMRPIAAARRLGRFLLDKFGPAYLQEEQRAWDVGFQYLRDNGIQVGWQLEESREQGLRWYRGYLHL